MTAGAMSRVIRVDAEVRDRLEGLADDFGCSLGDAVRIVVEGSGRPHGSHAEPVLHLDCPRCWPR